MKINKNNCEAFFLDYYEGNLSKEGVDELFSFLILNPEMREVFDSYEEVSFSPDKQIHFDGKADLKKTVQMPGGINELNYEEYFVSEVEGLLNAEEQIALENFIALHPSKQSELDLLRKVILVPDETVVFEHKSSLMKSVLVAEANFEEMAISSMEGLLNVEEEKAFANSLVENVDQQKAYALYQQTKLSPDLSVVFEDKDSLKREENDRGVFWWMLDIRFATAAVVALLLGIFFWNYSGNDTENGRGSIAKVDSSKNKNGVNPTPKSKDQLANNGLNNSIPKVIEPHNNLNHPKQIANQIAIPSHLAKDNSSFVSLVRNNKTLKLANASDPQVEFSDAYYNYANFQSPTPLANNDISLQQAAMRWMKKKLERKSNNSLDDMQDENAAYSTFAANNKKNDVTGFDLTSSAVDRLSDATGANFHLGKEPEGTFLTVGKYHLWLNRN